MWLTLVIALGALLALGWAWRAWQLARLIEDTPTSLTRSAAQGYVRLDGETRLMPDEPVIAPLSRRECVWWRISVEERGQRDRWHTIAEESSTAIFALVDSTGSVLVDPEGADVHGSTSDCWYGDTPQPVAGPPPMAGFRGFGDRYRYREERIDAGSFLTVLGQLGTERAATGPAHEAEIAARLRVWKRDPVRVAVFDANGDGRLDQDEWETARAAARRESILEAATAEQRPVAILRAPRHGRPYLLGAMDPAAFADRHRRRALFGGVLFLVATAVLVQVMLDQGVATPP